MWAFVWMFIATDSAGGCHLAQLSLRSLEASDEPPLPSRHLARVAKAVGKSPGNAIYVEKEPAKH
jgi:hypothetical protein